MEFKGKSVLFMCPAFFGYEVSIKSALIENGFEVDFFDERTSNNSFMKAIFRVKKSLLNNVIKKHYTVILDAIAKKKYDYFFLIKGEVVPEWFIEKFISLNPNAKLIFYTYDSIKNNNTNSIYIMKHFHKCFSFDFEDVKKYPNLILKHLFYSDEFINKADVKKKYDISFIGTLHSNRFSTMKTIFSEFDSTYVFYYLPAKWFFFFEKLTKKEYKQIKYSDVSFSKKTKQDVADIFKASKSVLDVQRFGQTGLTMRTFEVLATGAALITTNTYIKQADFYDPDKIIVIEDLNQENISELVKSKIEKIDFSKSISLKFDIYHVNTWVREFFY